MRSSESEPYIYTGMQYCPKDPAEKLFKETNMRLPEVGQLEIEIDAPRFAHLSCERYLLETYIKRSRSRERDDKC